MLQRFPQTIARRKKSCTARHTGRTARIPSSISIWGGSFLCSTRTARSCTCRCIRKEAGQSFEGSVQEHFPIHALKGSLDIYPILRKFDICITDYSSLALDFLVLDRPILYYQYDLDTYAATAGFEDSYQDLIAGPQARTQEEFRDALEAALSGQDGHAAKRKKVYDLVFDRHDAGASKRVFEAVRADAGIAD